jgi:hypothetical protein
MVIRHAEKPDTYNGTAYDGVNSAGTICGKAAKEHLVTLGWQRTGGLVSLFAPPWGPQQGLSTPQFLFASDPTSTSSDSTPVDVASTTVTAASQEIAASQEPAKNGDDGTSAASSSGSAGPSQRPFETLTALAARLDLAIDTSYSKKHYHKMVKSAVACNGIVLIAWQHQDIPLENGDKKPGLSQCILTETGTTSTFDIPTTWPTTPSGAARYDLVFVFDRPTGTGPITNFTIVPQFLLAGDLPWPA